MNLKKYFTSVTPLSKIIALGLLVTLPFIGFYIGWNFALENPIPNSSKEISTVEDTTNSPTSQLILEPLDIEDVMTSIALLHIPEEKIDIEHRATKESNFSAFSMTLSGQQYQKLDEYFGLTVFANPNDITFDNKQWEAFSPTESLLIYTKLGTICTLHVTTMFNPNDPLTFSCAQISNLSENTAEKVTPFMLNIFSEAGITCENDCPISQIEEIFYIPMYSRIASYFDETSKFTNQEIIDTQLEIIDATRYLISQGWEASFEDYTETERGWDPETPLSMKMVAQNDIMECDYQIGFSSHLNSKRYILNCNYKEEALLNNQDEINLLLDL